MSRKVLEGVCGLMCRAGLAALAVALGTTAPAKAQPPNIVQVATGQVHSCALEESGQVWCWGKNSFGQLGDGATTDRLRAVRVQEREPPPVR